MIKAKASYEGGKELVIIGLSDENMRRIKEGQPAIIDFNEMGLGNIQVVIFTGKDELTMQQQLQDLDFINDKTQIIDKMNKG